MVDEAVGLLPTSRRGWGWALLLLGGGLAVLVWFTGAPVRAVAVSGAAYAVAAFLGLVTLLTRRSSGWWAFLGVLAAIAATGAFALLR
ncbi:MAG TPA: hypothetical protein VGD67_11765 [Pseudonocardiaceae bacterium]